MALRQATPGRLLGVFVVALAAATSPAVASTSSSPHVLTFQQERFVHCGSRGAVKGYDKPGSCVRLGRVILGPGAFALARRLPAGATPTSVGTTTSGPWVEVVLATDAKVVMERELRVAFAKPDALQHGFDFVFDGRPLLGSIGGDGISVFLLAPDVRTARQIVALVCHDGCNKPFPGPTG